MKFKSDTVSYMNICWVEKINGLHVYTYKNKNPNQIFAYLKIWVFSFNSFSMFLIYRDILPTTFVIVVEFYTLSL